MEGSMTHLKSLSQRIADSQERFHFILNDMMEKFMDQIRQMECRLSGGFPRDPSVSTEVLCSSQQLSKDPVRPSQRMTSLEESVIEEFTSSVRKVELPYFVSFPGQEPVPAPVSSDPIEIFVKTRLRVKLDSTERRVDNELHPTWDSLQQNVRIHQPENILRQRESCLSKETPLVLTSANDTFSSQPQQVGALISLPQTDPPLETQVENVKSEENTRAAFDLKKIYSELIATCFPIIESQQIYPIDLKEVIFGTIFVFPICSDACEFMDDRKGVELCPGCGVDGMLIENLCATSFDGPTKVKILSGIAEEHNVKWDPASFLESDVKFQDEFCIGKNTSGNYMIPLVQTHPYFGDPEYPSSCISSKREAICSKSKTVHEHKEVFSDTEVRDCMHNTFGRLNSQSESQSQEMDFRCVYPEEDNISFGGQNGNIFEDAAFAAQATAKSAVLASKVTRATAELSRQGERAGQYAVRSSTSTVFGKRDEPPQQYTPCDNNNLSSKADNGMFYRSSFEVRVAKIDRGRQEYLVVPSESRKKGDGLDNAGTFCKEMNCEEGRRTEFQHFNIVPNEIRFGGGKDKGVRYLSYVEL